MREKRKEIVEKRRKIEQELNGSDVDDQIKKAESNIRKDELRIESLQTELKIQNVNASERNMYNDDSLAVSAEREVEQLRRLLAEAKEKQRLEEEKLQSLENKQLVPTEKSKSFFASIASAVKKFINRKSIAMEKRQTEISITKAREVVNLVTNNVESIEAKLKNKESRAKSYRSEYERRKLEAEKTKLGKEEKINSEIKKISEYIKIQEVEKKKLEAKKQENSNRAKEEIERLKQEYEQAGKELEQVTKKMEQDNKKIDDISEQIMDKQEQVKKIDPNQYLTSEQLDVLLDYVTGGAYKSIINQRGKTAQESKTGTTPKTPTSDSKNGGTKDTRTNTEIKRENFKDKLKEGVRIYINDDLKDDPQFEEQEVQTFSTPLSDREQEGEDFVKE